MKNLISLLTLSVVAAPLFAATLTQAERDKVQSSLDQHRIETGDRQ
jgi:hypothetical protein